MYSTRHLYLRTGRSLLNRYAYSTNDPANITDPSGLCPGGVAQNSPSDNSQQSSGHGGPNANDANVDPGAGSAQDGHGGCMYSESLWDWLDYGGGGFGLNGGDITVATETLVARTCNGTNQTGLSVNTANGSCPYFNEVHILLRVDRDPGHVSQASFYGRTIVTRRMC